MTSSYVFALSDEQSNSERYSVSCDIYQFWFTEQLTRQIVAVLWTAKRWTDFLSFGLNLQLKSENSNRFNLCSRT